jgi:hypothetical protein
VEQLYLPIIVNLYLFLFFQISTSNKRFFPFNEDNYLEGVLLQTQRKYKGKEGLLSPARNSVKSPKHWVMAKKQYQCLTTERKSTISLMNGEKGEKTLKQLV